MGWLILTDSPSLPPSLPPLYVLVQVDRREVVGIIRIGGAASRTKPVEVFLDVVPAVATDLKVESEGGKEGRREGRRGGQ